MGRKEKQIDPIYFKPYEKEIEDYKDALRYELDHFDIERTDDKSYVKMIKMARVILNELTENEQNLLIIYTLFNRRLKTFYKNSGMSQLDYNSLSNKMNLIKNKIKEVCS